MTYAELPNKVRISWLCFFCYGDEGNGHRVNMKEHLTTANQQMNSSSIKTTMQQNKAT